MQEKEDFVQDTMMLDVEARISIQLAMSIPVSIEGSAAYQLKEDSTSQTQSFILKFLKISHIHEVPKEGYMGKGEEMITNPGLKAAYDNEAVVTHVVTYVEYGSQLHIELEYEGNTTMTKLLIT